MAFWAYLLRCGDGSFYAGHTDALEPRIGAHQVGRGCTYTAKRLPVALAWAQDFPTRVEALEAEHRIKGWSRAKKEALIAGDWERVSELARSRNPRPSTSSGRTDGKERTDSPRVSSCGVSNSAKNSVRPELVEGQATPTPPLA